MKKLLLLAFFAFFAISCEKDNLTMPQTPPTPIPTEISQWETNAGFPGYQTIQSYLHEYKKGGNGNTGGNSSSENNGIRIVWINDAGDTVDTPLTLSGLGSTKQLYVEYLETDIPANSIINWYTIDQQIAYIYWDGIVKNTWIDYWFYPRWGVHYGNVTVITAMIYRPNPNWNGNNPNNQWLEPYQDNLVVYVE